MADDGEWDPRKAATTLEKHGVDFADAVTVSTPGAANGRASYLLVKRSRKSASSTG
jgi:uncharacterized DUF497 family protein